MTHHRTESEPFVSVRRIDGAYRTVVTYEGLEATHLVPLQRTEAQMARQRDVQQPVAARAEVGAPVAQIEAAARLADAAPEPPPAELLFEIPPGPRLGDLVIEANDVTKAFGDKLLMDDLDFKLPPGGIVGVERTWYGGAASNRTPSSAASARIVVPGRSDSGKTCAFSASPCSTRKSAPARTCSGPSSGSPTIRSMIGSTPRSFSIVAAAATFSALRDRTKTFAPASAKRRAIPRLMPLVPPATRTVRPLPS